ncbi:serine/threonine-protein kinase [Nocardia brevicatena]|uniref:serine/threonine-protein kinase n=1 Tax=Nocardia brevicatena TaxID=37327 RepID=UPI000594A83A|nr:serine/threonine-protein kinase [Nocardia brevicatena]
MQPLGTHDPTRIGDYRLLGVLGAGGMGRVYLGRNSGGRTVAVKVIRPDMIDAEFRERFRREVAAARRVDGRFTAPVLDADVDADPPWVATGYVAGSSLAEVVERYGALGEDSLLVLAHGLLEALAAVHRSGVVHRDLKPSNVLLAFDGPKVIDFGIARAVEDSKLTTTGKVIGSPGFMCPEQVTGDPVGPAADIFAFGGVLVFAATGCGPFGVGDGVQMLWRVVYEDPRLGDLPERLRPLIAACLSKDPAGRPTTDLLLADLTAIGIPDRVGWLPGPVVEVVSRRAVELLQLESGPIAPARTATGLSAPARTAETGHSTPPPYAGITDPERLASTQVWQPAPPQGSAPFAEQPFRQPSLGKPPPWRSPDAPVSSPRRRARAALIVGAVMVGVAVAVTTFMVGARLRDDNPSDTATGSSSAAIESTGAATPAVGDTSVTAVPKPFVGEWKGAGRDGLVAFDIVLTIRDGGIGEEVAQSSNTGKVSGSRCERTETLTGATETELTFVARLSGGAADCMDDGAASTVRLLPDGSLSYRTPGMIGAIEGVLRRS